MASHTWVILKLNFLCPWESYQGIKVDLLTWWQPAWGLGMTLLFPALLICGFHLVATLFCFGVFLLFFKFVCWFFLNLCFVFLIWVVLPSVPVTVCTLSRVWCFRRVALTGQCKQPRSSPGFDHRLWPGVFFIRSLKCGYQCEMINVNTNAWSHFLWLLCCRQISYFCLEVHP